ncbi:CCA tRNA nucleotidyltransferase [soil metagenome]
MWVVGGAVRDAAAAREVGDVDLAVEPEDVRELARALAAEPGAACFELSAQFRTWRVVSADRSWHLDLTGLRGATISEDLALRDFTANALAVPIDDLAAEPIDLAGGLADAESKLLRAVSATTFSDDPLRIMRAARQAAELGFEVEIGTLELARVSSERAGEPAGERQLAELRLLLAGPDPLRGLRLLDELGGTAGVMPELEALRGVRQNPNHHLDVYGHTIEVLERWLAIEQDLDFYAGESAARVADLLAEPLADGWTRRDALRLGAITHDVGKPATRIETPDWVTFIGHDSEGAKILEGTLDRLKASRVLSRYVQGLAMHHLRLGFLVPECPLSRARLYDYLNATQPIAADVTLLTIADRLAARGAGPTASDEMINGHLALAKEVLPAALDWHSSGPPDVPIRGDELASELGIEPGPRLGELIERVRAGVFEGEVQSPGDAVKVARSALAELGE